MRAVQDSVAGPMAIYQSATHGNREVYLPTFDGAPDTL